FAVRPLGRLGRLRLLLEDARGVGPLARLARTLRRLLRAPATGLRRWVQWARGLRGRRHLPRSVPAGADGSGRRPGAVSPVAVSPVAVSPVAVSPVAVSPVAVSPVAVRLGLEQEDLDYEGRVVVRVAHEGSHAAAHDLRDR